MVAGIGCPTHHVHVRLSMRCLGAVPLVLTRVEPSERAERMVMPESSSTRSPVRRSRLQDECAATSQVAKVKTLIQQSFTRRSCVGGKNRHPDGSVTGETRSERDRVNALVTNDLDRIQLSGFSRAARYVDGADL